MALGACGQNVPFQPLPEKPTVDQVLTALQSRGQNFNDFTADVKLADSDPITARESTRSGKVYFQRKADGDARIRVTFETYKASGPAIQQRQDWLLADGVLTDQNFQTKLQVSRQVLKPGQKLNPLKLGEGPFPLPIGQSPQEAQKMFAVKVMPADKDDPANTVHVELTPKPGTRFASRFETIDVWVNRGDGFTPRIQTTDKGGGTIHTTDLTNVKINTGLKDADFKLAEPGRDWGVRNEELAD
jgi:outer membrane lipoprotein-sorting protein